MLLLPVEQRIAVQRRVHVAGRDDVDADGVGRPFRGEGFGQLGYGCFGGAGSGGGRERPRGLVYLCSVLFCLGGDVGMWVEGRGGSEGMV